MLGVRELVRSSRAAAGAVRVGGLVALGDLERVAAATRSGDVRIVDREAALQAFDEVDLGALAHGAVGVDDDSDSLQLELVVAFHRAPVEAERVLEARTAAALDGNADDRRLPAGSSAISSVIFEAPALGQRDNCDRSPR